MRVLRPICRFNLQLIGDVGANHITGFRVTKMIMVVADFVQLDVVPAKGDPVEAILVAQMENLLFQIWVSVNQLGRDNPQ